MVAAGGDAAGHRGEADVGAIAPHWLKLRDVFALDVDLITCVKWIVVSILIFFLMVKFGGITFLGLYIFHWRLFAMNDALNSETESVGVLPLGTGECRRVTVLPDFVEIVI